MYRIVSDRSFINIVVYCWQMAQLITVRLNKSNQEPLGFRLQGGKDFGTPLAVQKVSDYLAGYLHRTCTVDFWDGIFFYICDGNAAKLMDDLLETFSVTLLGR